MSKPVKNTSWNVADLTLRQRDVLIDLVNTNDGSSFLDKLEGGNFNLKLKAANGLAKVGIVTVSYAFDGDGTQVIVALTPEGEAWLLTLAEGALADLG